MCNFFAVFVLTECMLADHQSHFTLGLQKQIQATTMGNRGGGNGRGAFVAVTEKTENPIDDHINIYDDIPLSSANQLTNVVEETIPYKKSIYEDLTEQVDLNFSDYVDRSIGYTLIEHLDSDGYFRSNIAEISHQLNIPESG